MKLLSLTEPYASLIIKEKKLKLEVGKQITEVSFLFMLVKQK